MSYGQQLTRRFLERFLYEPFLENHRPEWLFGMELDFFFPDLNFAVEFNGDQHYYKTEDFGDPSSQVYRDRRKMAICRERGITLLVIQAIDLQKGVMKRHLKRCLPGLPKKKVGRKQCQLERDATAYRKTLIQTYNSPTARRRGSGVRKSAHISFEQKSQERRN